MTGPIRAPNFPHILDLSLYTSLTHRRSQWKAILCERTTYYWLSFASFSAALFLDVSAFGALQNSGLHRDETQRTVGLLFLLHVLWSLFVLLGYFLFFIFRDSTFAKDDIKLGLGASLSCQSPIMIFLLLGPNTLLKGFESNQISLRFFVAIECLSIISSSSLCIASWITYVAAVRARGEWYLPVWPTPIVEKWTMATPSESSKCSSFYFQDVLQDPVPFPWETSQVMGLRYLVVAYLHFAQGGSKISQLLHCRVTYHWISSISLSLSLIPTMLILSVRNFNGDMEFPGLGKFAIIYLVSLCVTCVRFWAHFQKVDTRHGFSNAGMQFRIGMAHTAIFWCAILFVLRELPGKHSNAMQKFLGPFIIRPSFISACSSIMAAHITYIAAMETHGNRLVPVIPRPIMRAWEVARGYELESI